MLEQVGLLGHVAANKEAKKRKGSGGAEGSGSW